MNPVVSGLSACFLLLFLLLSGVLDSAEAGSRWRGLMLLDAAVAERAAPSWVPFGVGGGAADAAVLVLLLQKVACVLGRWWSPSLQRVRRFSSVFLNLFRKPSSGVT